MGWATLLRTDKTCKQGKTFFKEKSAMTFKKVTQ